MAGKLSDLAVMLYTEINVNDTVETRDVSDTSMSPTGTNKVVLWQAVVDFLSNYFGQAAAISFTPTGTISATNVQAAIAEVAIEAIPNNAVDNTKLADMVQGTIKGRTAGAGTGDPVDLSAAATKTILAITSSDVSGLGSLATASTVNLSTQATGTLQAAQTPAYTGDVTSSAGGLANTIPNNTVTNAKAADMAANTLKGNNTGASADPLDLTGTQATALLDTFTAAAKGVAPAAGTAVTRNFLSAAGTWISPRNGAAREVQFSDDVNLNINGATYLAIDTDLTALLPSYTPTSTAGIPARPVKAKPKLVSVGWGASTSAPWPMIISASGRPTWVAPATWSLMGLTPDWGLATISYSGWPAWTAVGTLTAATPASNSVHNRARRTEVLVTAAATTAVAGAYSTPQMMYMTGASGYGGGVLASMQWGIATGGATTTNRAFCGFSAATGAPTDVEPSSLLNSFGMGWDAADTNVQFMVNDASGTATKVDLGASFPVGTADRTSWYELLIYQPFNVAEVNWLVINTANGSAMASGTATAKIPGAAVQIRPRCWASVGGTSSVIGVALGDMKFWVHGN
jgi:hypothetical protein